MGAFHGPAFRGRAPRIVKDNATGKERPIIEEHTSDARLSIGRVGTCQGLIERHVMVYKDGADAALPR